MSRDILKILMLGIVSSALALALYYFGMLTGLETEFVRWGLVNGGSENVVLQVGLVGLAGLLVAWWALTLTHPVLFGLVMLLVLAEWMLFKPLLGHFGWDFAVVPGVIAILLSGLGGTILQRLPGQKRRRQLWQALDGRSSRAVREKFLERPPTFDSAVRVAVVTYADPGEQFEFPLELLLDYGGIVLENTPRRTSVIFSGYTAGDDPPLRACEALLDACRQVRRKEVVEPESGGDGTAIPVVEHPQIAVECGEARARLVTGEHGPELVFDGPLPGLAWRLNQACALFPARIIAGPKIHQAVGNDALFRPVELVRFGVNQPVREIYQLIGLRENTQPKDVERVENFWKGVIFFREGEYGKSHEAFLEAQPLEGKDPLLEDYLKRLKRAQSEEADVQAGARRARPAFVI